ncbi:adenylate-forming reductase 03009-like [Cornus florida]|uniref:adenylate-forming reductase 03009-like n=1 Tax=Cornus florida TaxID=4283 RepID=UPI002899ACE0|nr:adenylate-forming reductase 03009-like [Cornus florida]
MGKLFQGFPIWRSDTKSASRASSHFCDLDIEDDKDVDHSLESLKEGQENEGLNKQQVLELLLPLARSKREQPPSKPTKPKESRLSVILLDQGLFTVYKRLFVVCLALNITALVVAASGHFSYANRKAVLFSIANIFALTFCRSEAFLRVVFWLVVNVLGWSCVPLRIKTATTSLLQSLSGIHSGCGISSIAWLIIGVASAILALLCLSSLVWAFILLKISYDSMTKSYRDHFGFRLVKHQEFWFTLAITVLIIIPWVTMRRVPVKVSAPSGHASIIKFEGGVKSGILGRISPSPFSEWHAFGIISDDKQKHMMLAGAVGDFTKSLVSNAPSYLLVRQVHFAGLPYLTNMYDRVLLVATGLGICVFLSFLLQPCSEIKEMMSGHPKEKVIVYDTAVLGRPNVSQMNVDAAKRWGAQVVIVTSNSEGSRDVVNACKDAGIPGFGPIWDS